MPEPAWTLDTLYLHLATLLDERDRRYEQRFADLEKATLVALEAAKEAVVKAELATDKRFESVNEFRATLSDQANQFITRTEAKAAIERNSERVQELTDRMNTDQGRGDGLHSGWIYLLGAVAALGTVFTIYLMWKGLHP